MAGTFSCLRGKALRSTEANLESFKSRKVELETKNLQLCKEAKSAADKLTALEIVVIRSASDTGALYGSVTKRDISEAAEVEGIGIARQQIELSRPIKELGLHNVVVTLHPEVQISISVNVARSEEEAKIQSPGGKHPSLGEDKANDAGSDHGSDDDADHMSPGSQEHAVG